MDPHRGQYIRRIDRFFRIQVIPGAEGFGLCDAVDHFCAEKIAVQRFAGVFGNDLDVGRLFRMCRFIPQFLRGRRCFRARYAGPGSGCDAKKTA